MLGLSLVATSGVYSSLQCAGFSLHWLLLLLITELLQASVVAADGLSSCDPLALEYRLSSYGTLA